MNNHNINNSDDNNDKIIESNEIPNSIPVTNDNNYNNIPTINGNNGNNGNRNVIIIRPNATLIPVVESQILSPPQSGNDLLEQEQITLQVRTQKTMYAVEDRLIEKKIRDEEELPQYY